MYTVYILKSELAGRYYVGHTSDLLNRLERHNSGYVRSTKAYRPWNVVYTEKHPTKQETYKRELKIKSYKKGEAFNDLLKK